jgi:hypothetical protein
MGSIFNLQVSEQRVEHEKLHVDFRKQTIRAMLNVVRFRDKDTQQIVAYIQSLDISGYGATAEKAEEMLRFATQDFFAHLFTLSLKQLQSELQGLGWKKGFFNKDYSKAYVDEEGELKNYNAEEVKRFALTSA